MSGFNTEISGTVERITFFNPENNFTIFRLKSADKGSVAVLGSPYKQIYVGEMLKISGAWHQDKKYGEQFKATIISHAESNTPDSIERYIGSGLISGIGRPLARRIIEMFGGRTTHIFDNEPEELLKVAGIGKIKLEMIIESWKENREASSVLAFLQEHNISAGLGIKIYRHYGSNAVEILKENPYRLALDISGIGFLISDSIAQKLGMALNSPKRGAAAIFHILSEAAEVNGFCSMPADKLLSKLHEIGVARENAISQLVEMNNESHSIVVFSKKENDVIDSIQADVLHEDNAAYYLVFLKKLFDTERSIAQKLVILSTHGASVFQKVSYLEGLELLGKERSLLLSASQKNALETILGSKFVVITGGPGTGKTTMISSILLLTKHYYPNAKIDLVAPTGRAAKRMQESTGFAAKTIHRLLEYDPIRSSFRHNGSNRLRSDLLILDESSMIDIRLMKSLLSALPDTTTVILVGDIDQIPSIGPGNILSDIIRSRALNCVCLKEIFRQAAASAIISNAHRINQSQMPVFTQDQNGTDCWFEEHENPETLSEHIIELYKTKVLQFCKSNKLQLKRDVQILLPMQKGFTGIKYINERMQAFFATNEAMVIEQTLIEKSDTKHVYSNSSFNIQRGELRFYLGDKVMQIENNYDKNVFNGDLGVVVSISAECLEITFDERKITYSINEIHQIRLAYAITIHKSQGSEYPVIIMPIMNTHFIMLNKNIIYTALTRARKLAIIMGQKAAIMTAVRNASNRERHTLLYYWLQKGLNKIDLQSNNS